MTVSRFVPPSEIAVRIGVTKRAVWQMVERGDLPRPARLTPRRVGWAEETWQAWAAERVAQAA